MLPIARHLALLVASLPAAGCSSRGAPSFELAGAYFPGWMLIALLGALAAILARAIFVATKLADTVPFPLAVSVSIGVTVGVLVWSIWFAL